MSSSLLKIDAPTVIWSEGKYVSSALLIPKGNAVHHP